MEKSAERDRSDVANRISHHILQKTTKQHKVQKVAPRCPNSAVVRRELGVEFRALELLPQARERLRRRLREAPAARSVSDRR